MDPRNILQDVLQHFPFENQGTNNSGEVTSTLPVRTEGGANTFQEYLDWARVQTAVAQEVYKEFQTKVQEFSLETREAAQRLLVASTMEGQRACRERTASVVDDEERPGPSHGSQTQSTVATGSIEQQRKETSQDNDNSGMNAMNDKESQGLTNGESQLQNENDKELSNILDLSQRTSPTPNHENSPEIEITKLKRENAELKNSYELLKDKCRMNRSSLEGTLKRYGKFKRDEKTALMKAVVDMGYRYALHQDLNYSQIALLMKQNIYWDKGYPHATDTSLLEMYRANVSQPNRAAHNLKLKWDRSVRMIADTGHEFLDNHTDLYNQNDRTFLIKLAQASSQLSSNKRSSSTSVTPSSSIRVPPSPNESQTGSVLLGGNFFNPPNF